MPRSPRLTGQRWSVLEATEGGDETIRQREEASAAERREEISKLPMMQSIMKTFPGATIEEIKTIASETGKLDPLPEQEEEDIE